jgi:glutamyl-tRNA synthetase
VAETGGVPGRFAPSPTGPLHVGNLRTALAAWLLARSTGDAFLVRMEDLDRLTSSTAHEGRQLAELATIGLDWDGPVVRQSERLDRYRDAIDALDAAGRTYECFCSRREIREAAQAPHGGEVAYPGTCRHLTAAQRAVRRRERPPALRLLAPDAAVTVEDVLRGPFSAVPDDVVLRRNDGVPAYNLAVVVDDAAQGVTVVARGDDLLASSPRQALLQDVLGLPRVRYAHVPLVVGADGQRLAKRHGAVTLEELAVVPVGRIVAALAASLGLAVPAREATARDLLATFAVADLARRRTPTDLADLQRSWS